MISLFQKHFDKSYEPLVKIQKAWGTSAQAHVLAKEYDKIPKTSIDFAINSKLESADQLVISADLGWRDVGTWNELKDEMAEKPNANILQGDVLDIDVKDSLIYSTKDGKIIAAIGLEGLIVVDTEDALLVCTKERTHDVKKVIEHLKNNNKDSHL